MCLIWARRRFSDRAFAGLGTGMKPKTKEKPRDLTGRIVRGYDGGLYRVTMRGACSDPWGRPEDGGDVVEIPRPFAVIGVE